MNALVTGHQGYIGSHVYKELQSMGINVMGIDLQSGEDIQGRRSQGRVHRFLQRIHPPRRAEHSHTGVAGRQDNVPGQAW